MLYHGSIRLIGYPEFKVLGCYRKNSGSKASVWWQTLVESARLSLRNEEKTTKIAFFGKEYSSVILDHLYVRFRSEKANTDQSSVFLPQAVKQNKGNCSNVSFSLAQQHHHRDLSLIAPMKYEAV